MLSLCCLVAFMLNVLDASYDGALYLCPVDAVVQLFVHQPYGAYIVAAHNIHAQGIYRRGFGVVWCSDDALDSVAEDLVSPSVSKSPSQDQSAAVSRGAAPVHRLFRRVPR